MELMPKQQSTGGVPTLLGIRKYLNLTETLPSMADENKKNLYRVTNHTVHIP